MKKLLTMPWELTKALFGLAFPMFRGGGTIGATGGSLGAWIARAALLAVFLLGLGWLNQWPTLGLTSWIHYGRIRNFWLPLFAFSSYAMVWLGWVLYRVLSIDIGPDATEFPDLDHAWNQAVDALTRAEIHLEETPLFLILGGTADGDEPLFRSAGIKAQVKQVPQDPTEPLHVTANRDAIWVSCPGASALGQQHSVVGGSAAESTLATLSDQTGDPFKTAGVAAGATLRIEDFMASLKKAQPHPRNSHHHHQKELDTDKYLSRLRYLCRLIARDRQGFCPINGVLIVLPITAAGPDKSPEDLALACKSDLAEMFGVLAMRCPVIVLVSDLEKLAGFAEIIERLPSGQTGKRMGQRFPFLPDLENGAVPGSIESSVSWIGNTLFPSMVYSLFKVESPGGEDATDVLKANSQLYRFLSKIRERHEPTARLVKESIPAVPGEPILFGGCYFAGTGVNSGNGQAFASGVLRRMIDDQDNVTWTSNAMNEDTSLLRLANGLKIVFLTIIGLGILSILVVIGLRFFPRAEQPADADANAAFHRPMTTILEGLGPRQVSGHDEPLRTNC
jgi:IcmF-related N-terminal domain